MQEVKEEIIKNLNNIKIVLGNGCDMFCGLKSSYSDFFESQKYKYNSLLKYITFAIRLKNQNKALPPLTYATKHCINGLKDFTVWDIFFILNSIDLNDVKNFSYNYFIIHFDHVSYRSDFLWCNIEKTMNESLIDSKESKKIIWENVFSYYLDPINYEKYSDYEHIVACFIKAQNIFYSEYEEDFYNYLLEELKRFENKFGDYIKKQCSNEIYQKNFKELLNKLTLNQIDHISSIDSFNYSKFGDKSEIIINNINGNYNAPIFGVDSNGISDESYRYDFTKISRKMELDLDRKYLNTFGDFSNIIIFGHSLSSNDYGYFFPLIKNLGDSGIIIFAYSIYDDKITNKIKSDLKRNIIRLIDNYEKEYLKQEKRQLDLLWFNGRIFTYCIDNSSIERIPEIENFKFLDTK